MKRRIQTILLALIVISSSTLTSFGSDSRGAFAVQNQSSQGIEATLILAMQSAATAATSTTTTTTQPPNPNPPIVLMPEASGTTVRSNARIEVDMSNTRDGYVMVRTRNSHSTLTKVLLTDPKGVVHTYTLRTDTQWDVFPLASGNGTYTIGVFRNISGNQFSTEFSTTASVTLVNEFAPFLRPHQFVNYNENTLAVIAASELVRDAATPLEKIEIIYGHVTAKLSYDTELARTVQSGYVPNLDKVWSSEKGICFCIASLTAAMLRSQGIPTRLVFGYVRDVYHAWISVWTEETGWVDTVIYFDGKKWILMDPTFRIGASSSQSLSRFIGDGSRYTVRFNF